MVLESLNYILNMLRYDSTLLLQLRLHFACITIFQFTTVKMRVFKKGYSYEVRYKSQIVNIGLIDDMRY